MSKIMNILCSLDFPDGSFLTAQNFLQISPQDVKKMLILIKI